MRRVKGSLVLAVLALSSLVGGCFLFGNRPPEAAFAIVYDVDPVDPLIVALDASASSDPDGAEDIVLYSWVFGDDVTILSPLEFTKSVQTPSIRVRYPVEGSYTATLVVRDSVGNSSLPISKQIIVPNVPVAPTRR